MFERAIGAVAVNLNPTPASERITARNRRDIADAHGAHDLVPAG